MDTGLCLTNSCCSSFESFRCKADVVKWAMLVSSKVEDGITNIDYKKAKEVIDFVNKNVELPDIPQDYLDGITRLLEKYMKEKET